MLGAVGGRGCQLSERGQKGLGRSIPPHPRLPGADGSGGYWGGDWALPLGGSGANPGCTRGQGDRDSLRGHPLRTNLRPGALTPLPAWASTTRMP